MFKFWIMGLAKTPQEGSDLGYERKSSMEEKNDSRNLNEDAGLFDTQDARFIEDVQIDFDGGVGSLRGGAKIFDLFIAFGSPRDLINQAGEILDRHMLGETGFVLQMRARGDIESILEVIEGFEFKSPAVFETGEGYPAPILIKSIGTAKEAARGEGFTPLDSMLPYARFLKMLLAEKPGNRNRKSNGARPF